MRLDLIAFLCSLATASAVETGFGNADQDWGLYEIRPRATIFWWLFYSKETTPAPKPIIFWIAGGPGISATGVSNFLEIGPLYDITVPNYISPTTTHLVFVDSPTGTGFSYVENPFYFAYNDSQIATDFVKFLKLFFKDRPELKEGPIYLFGEEYGGKSAVQIALLINEEYKNQIIDFNLNGIALGNPWISPMDSVKAMPDYLYNMGMLDPSLYKLYKEVTNYFLLLCQKKVRQKSPRLTPKTYYRMLQSFVYTVTKADFYNVLRRKDFDDVEKVPGTENLHKTLEDNMILDFVETPDALNLAEMLTPELLESHAAYLTETQHEELSDIMNVQVAQALEIEKLIKHKWEWVPQSHDVFEAFDTDYMKPVLLEMEKLLNETDLEITVYSGHLDMIVNTPGTIAALQQLKWPKASNWKGTPRKPVMLQDILQGYEKCYDKLCFYTILRAGQLAPLDNAVMFKYIMKNVVHTRTRRTGNNPNARKKPIMDRYEKWI